MISLSRRWGTRRFLLGFMIALAGALALPVAASAAITVNDNTSGPGPAGSNCAVPTYTGPTTIQTAINAASPGATILVCAGTYNNGGAGTAVVVNKSVTLRGAQAGVDARTRSVPGTSESIIDDDSGGIYIGSGVSDVTIDGFLVKNTTNDSFAAGMATPANANDQEIINNIIEDNIIGLYLNNQAGQTSVVRHNLFFNNNQTGSSAGNGIYADLGTDDVLIDANRFLDQANAGVLLSAAPPITNDRVDITNNQLQNTNSDVNLNVDRVVLLYTHNANVIGNTVTNADATGIQLLGENADTLIANNTVVGDGNFPGIGVRDCTAADSCAGSTDVGPNQRATITGNSLSVNSTGIFVRDHGYSGELFAHFNRIAGNTEGLRLDDVGESVDARNNWWGCNAGPGAVACDSIVQADPGDVTFNPWLVLGISASPTTVPTGGSSTVTASLAQNSAGATPGGNNFPAGIPIAFSATFGTISSPVATASPNATSIFHAGSIPGAGSVFAQLDNQSVSTPLTVTAAALAQQPSGRCENRKTGDSGPDHLVGTSAGDRLKGKGGDDVLKGKGGDDCLSGATENDRLNGGSGEDLLKGGAGDDAIYAKDGEPDRVRCGFGIDVAVVDAQDTVKACETVRRP
jgi:parallel beta-helix repeat protein